MPELIKAVLAFQTDKWGGRGAGFKATEKEIQLMHQIIAGNIVDIFNRTAAGYDVGDPDQMLFHGLVCAAFQLEFSCPINGDPRPEFLDSMSDLNKRLAQKFAWDDLKRAAAIAHRQRLIEVLNYNVWPQQSRLRGR
jgi:hypothetical protein